MPLMETLCYALARRTVINAQSGSVAAHPASFDPDKYQAWRKAELEGQFREHFRFDDIRGKDVVDFGCGAGELSLLLAANGAKSVVGIEADPKQADHARRQFASSRTEPRPTLQFSTSLDRIDRPDSSCDVILCFDVLEHILAYREIIPEWLRILRPGGQVLIWWTPFHHPHGHHLQSLGMPPWVHSALPAKTVLRACARVYDMPEFKPRIWDLDEQGRKKPNKWRKLQELPTLNRLTVSQFEKIATDTGFRIARAEYNTIKPVRKLVGNVARLPILRECLSGCVIYQLEKP